MTLRDFPQRASARAITCSQRRFSSSTSSPLIALRASSDGAPAIFQRHGNSLVSSHHCASCATYEFVDLIDFGGVLGDEAVRLDEIGEHVVAGTVPADAPHELVAITAHAARAAHQAVDVRHLVGHVVETGAVAARDRNAVMVRAAAHEVHHHRAVAPLETEHVKEERGLLLDLGAVDDDVGELGRAGGVVDRIGVLGDVGRDRNRVPFRRADTEAVAAACTLFQRLRRVHHLGAERDGLSVQGVDGGAVRRRQMHAEQRRARAFAQGQHVMVAAGAAHMQRVAVAGNILQRPDLAVEVGRLLQVMDGQFDAAQAVDPGGGHGSPPRSRTIRRLIAPAGGSADVEGSLAQICRRQTREPRRPRIPDTPHPPVALATRRRQIHISEPV